MDSKTETIAKIIKDEVDHWNGKDLRVQTALNEVSRNLAGYFETDNLRFDRPEFIKACGTIDNQD